MHFPDKLADVVVKRWDHLVTGPSYTAPPCPPKQFLAQLLSVAYLASTMPEEGRYPRFNIVMGTHESMPGVWHFDSPRPFTVSELRRLVPATDNKKSAILVEWNLNQLCIAGLYDMGTSWHRARAGLGYNYRVPNVLMVEVDKTSKIHVYQGQFRVASLINGEARGMAFSDDMVLALHGPANAGLRSLDDRLVRPTIEPPREYFDFEFLAMWNSYAGIANTIAQEGHGGALLLLPDEKLSAGDLRIKYHLSSSKLADSLVTFLNARHKLADRCVELGLDNGEPAPADLAQFQFWAHEAYVEDLRFVARLGQCDGAIAITQSLRVVGFGCEITSKMHDDTNVYEVDKELTTRMDKRPMDVEQFGMRHRSAVKFVSQNTEAVAIVISQDGPVSLIWAVDEDVLVRRGVRLVNSNIPWS